MWRCDYDGVEVWCGGDGVVVMVWRCDGDGVEI